MRSGAVAFALLLVSAALGLGPAAALDAKPSASASAPASAPGAGLNDVERLAAWAIGDFARHPPGGLLGFRAVHPARLRHPEGLRPTLCGEVQVRPAQGPVEWTGFATLETRGGYEQWLGASAGTWCNASTERDLSRDLSDHFTRALVRRD